MQIRVKCVKPFPGCSEGDVLKFSQSCGSYIPDAIQEGDFVTLSISMEFVKDNTEYFEEINDWKVWRADAGENYWFVPNSDWLPFLSRDDRSPRDTWLLDDGNYYRTEEGAKSVIDYKRFKVKMERIYWYIEWWIMEYSITSCDTKHCKVKFTSEEDELFVSLYRDHENAQKERFTIKNMI